MPLYEYKCQTCGEVLEVRQKFSDEPLTVHEKCGGRLERLISASSFHFKGSGFYATDYAKGGNGSKKAESESKSDSKSESKPEKKGSTDTTAAKTDSKPAESKPASSDKPKSE